jgi:hypothetical protein
MTIENINSVDFISLPKNNRRDVILSIVDHLDWSDEINHLKLIQSKIYRYLDFIESGEIYEKYPDAKGKNFIIEISGAYPLAVRGKELVDVLADYLSKQNYILRWKKLSVVNPVKE